MRPAEAIERGGELKVWLKAILAVQTCLIYREETERNINRQDAAKRAAKFQQAKNNSLARAPVKEQERYSALAKTIFENVCGKSSANPSEVAQPSLF